MTDREKIKIGLQCIIDGTVRCESCGYAIDKHGHYSCKQNCASDALTLLKAQEPRVMTLEEVKAFEWDYCYLEEERLPGKEYRRICGDYVLTCITWPYIASMRIQHGDDNYGKKWRCWSAKPTDEQRQDVKWE